MPIKIMSIEDLVKENINLHDINEALLVDNESLVSTIEKMKKDEPVEPIKEDTPFPRVMKSTTGNELIVFFTENGKGTVISDPKGFYEVGEFSTYWCMDTFKDYKIK